MQRTGRCRYETSLPGSHCHPRSRLFVCVYVRMSVCVYECVRRLKTMSFWDEVTEEMRMEFKALQETFIASSLDKEGTLTKKSDECRHHSPYHLSRVGSTLLIASASLPSTLPITSNCLSSVRLCVAPLTFSARSHTS